jgi:hypothetical protein
MAVIADPDAEADVITPGLEVALQDSFWSEMSEQSAIHPEDQMPLFVFGLGFDCSYCTHGISPLLRKSPKKLAEELVPVEGGTIS